jgi:hypothetical protein
MDNRWIKEMRDEEKERKMSERLIRVSGATVWGGDSFITIPKHHNLYAEQHVVQDMLDHSKEIVELATDLQDLSVIRQALQSIDSLEKALDEGLS